MASVLISVLVLDLSRRYLLACVSLLNLSCSIFCSCLIFKASLLIFLLLLSLFFAFFLVSSLYITSQFIFLHFCFCLIFLAVFLVYMLFFGLFLHLFRLLCDFYNGIESNKYTEYNRCVFYTYPLHSTSSTIINLKLLIIIYVNYFKPTLMMRKY